MSKESEMEILFTRLIEYSKIYDITYQMWTTMYVIFIEKEGVALWDYGTGDPLDTMRKAVEYLDSITKKEK